MGGWGGGVMVEVVEVVKELVEAVNELVEVVKQVVEVANKVVEVVICQVFYSVVVTTCSVAVVALEMPMWIRLATDL